MKTAIIYASVHHKNTLKLVQAIADKYLDTLLIDATKAAMINLSQYDLIGIASGIYYGSFHKSLIQFIRDNLTEHSKTFLLYTYGKDNPKYTDEVISVIKDRKSTVIGKYSCPGFDTFGPFKLVGGLQKGHPTEEEVQKSVDFYEDLIK